MTADNIYYFYRIGCFNFSSKQMDLFVSRLGTIPTIISYALDLILAYYDCAKKAGIDKKLKRKLLLEKKLFFI